MCVCVLAIFSAKATTATLFHSQHLWGCTFTFTFFFFSISVKKVSPATILLPILFRSVVSSPMEQKGFMVSFSVQKKQCSCCSSPDKAIRRHQKESSFNLFKGKQSQEDACLSVCLHFQLRNEPVVGVSCCSCRCLPYPQLSNHKGPITK